MAEQFPEEFGEYNIVEEVGRGGFAAVHKAVDTVLKRTVTLKVLAPHLLWDPAFVQRVRWKWVAGIGTLVVVIVGLIITLASGCRPATPPGIVYVPAGEFTMGSDEGDSNEQPVHTVYLDAFYIDKYEVTNAQFALFLSEQGNQEEGGVTWLDIVDLDCLITQSGGQYQPKSGYEDHPVIEVSWHGARAYCQWAGKRLPTEAEWEKAARGTDGRTYPWGEGIDCDHAQYGGCGGQTVPIGSKPKGASPYGALDMAGNVWEWVADWYDSGYYAASPQSNPEGSTSGDYRVIRGGSWANLEPPLRAALRRRARPAAVRFTVGFRCVR